MNEGDRKFCEKIGENLRRIMKEKNITQEELSYRTGIAQPSISRYLNGKTMPTVRPIHKITRAIECTVDELIGEE